MALKILKSVTAPGGLIREEGCYIQIKPYMPYDLPNIPSDRGIWGSKEDFDKNKSQPTIISLLEIPENFYLDPETAGDIYEGKNIVYKMLAWSNQAAKDAILEKNPTWSDKDIEIVDIPKA